MTGGTVMRNRIMRRLRWVLERQLDGRTCEPFGPDVKIIVAGKTRYPDALVTCTPQQDKSQVVGKTVVVFEVLGDSTSQTHRVEKVREYQATSSIQRYIILEQDSLAAIVYEPQGEDWARIAMGKRDILRMPEPGVEICLAEIYASAGA